MKINANGTEVTVLLGTSNQDDFISLTDIAKKKDAAEPRVVISNWLSSYSTIDFLATWECLYNPNFNRLQFQTVRSEPGRLIMTPKRWVEQMSAIGIITKAGRYGGGTYAHKDIAFEFASWISPEFKLYIIKDYQRLKAEESYRQSVGWDLKRELSKINYRIQTDAIKTFLIAPELTKSEISQTYANEADVLNMALFGKTAAQWRKETGKKGNMRDYASVEQLIVLVNLESMNADMIRQKLPVSERIQKLRSIAYYQLHSLQQSRTAKRLENKGINLLN